VDLSTPQLVSKSVDIKGAKLYLTTDGELGEELIIAQGQSAVKADPRIVYLSISPRGNSSRIICFVGARAKELGVSADSVVGPLAKLLGGSGGGSAFFAQGGGPLREKIADAQRMAIDLVSSLAVARG